MLPVLKKILSSLLALILSLAGLASPATATCEPEFHGTFLQPYEGINWPDARWQQEIANMKKVGIKYLIIQYTATMDKDGAWQTFYSSDVSALSSAAKPDYDVIDAALRNCQGTGIKVFIGLSTFDDWWVQSALTSTYQTSCEVSAQMATEIYNRYYAKYADDFYGWYFVPEINNVPNMQASIVQIAEGVNKVISALNSFGTPMPLLLSPYYTEYITVPSVLETLPQWVTFFSTAKLRDGDIFCPQDAIGAEWTDEKNLESVFKMYASAVQSANCKLKFWANAENFILTRGDTAGTGFLFPSATLNTETVPATMDRFVNQLKVESKYVDDIITFSYLDYGSPSVVNPVYNNTYLDYLANNHTLETVAPTAPAALTFSSENVTSVTLTWNASTDNIGVAYYLVYVDGKPTLRVEYDGASVPTTCKLTSSASSFGVVAVDGAGNKSEVSRVYRQ